MPVAEAIQAGLGVVQTLDGFIQRGKANKQMDKLQGQRKAYETPEEVYKILRATEQNAQTGLGAQTLNYLTGNADQVFSQAIEAITLNGGDPNSLGALFEQRVNQSMAIGAQNQAEQMANFAKFLGALNTLGENQAEEQISADNLIKDQIQAVSARGGDATRNIQGGLNSILGAASSFGMGKLYDVPAPIGVSSSGAQTYASAPSRISSSSLRSNTGTLNPSTMTSPRRGG